MLNSDMNLANGYMEQVCHQKMIHREWPVSDMYLYVCGIEFVNTGMAPADIIKLFMGKDIKSIKALTDTEIRTVPMTRKLQGIDKKRILKNAYNVCKSGLGKNDFMQYQTVGPFKCLQVWHIDDNGRPGFHMEAIYNSQTNNLNVCMCGIFKGAK